LFFWKIVKIAFKNESYKSCFSRRCSECPKIKIVHKFLIKNTNGMNKIFPYIKKYNLQGKKFINLNFCKKILLPPHLCFELIWTELLFLGTDWKRIIFPQSSSAFLSLKKVLQNQDKNLARSYLPQISFFLWRDNGPLGVNHVTYVKISCSWEEELIIKRINWRVLQNVWIWVLLMDVT